MVSIRLDINMARMAHVRWELALEALVGGADNAELLHGHEDCELGTWLYGTGLRRYGKLESIWHLKTAHKQFHIVANQTVAAVKSGQAADAARSMNAVQRLSGEILFQLTALELDLIEGAVKDEIEQNAPSRLIRLLLPKPKPINFLGIKTGKQSLPTLNVTGARLAHLKWIRDLQRTFRGYSKHPPPPPSDECSLGVWIHSKAMKELGATESLRHLDAIHKNFHREVDAVINRLAQRKYNWADESYEKALDLSRAIITELTKLQLLHLDTDFFQPTKD